MPSQAKPSGSGGAKRANAAEAAAHVAASRSGERPSGRAIKQNGSGKSRQTAEREAEQKRPLTAEQRRQLANKVEVLKRDLVHRVLEKKINGKKASETQSGRSLSLNQLKQIESMTPELSPQHPACQAPTNYDSVGPPQQSKLSQQRPERAFSAAGEGAGMDVRFHFRFH